MRDPDSARLAVLAPPNLASNETHRVVTLERPTLPGNLVSAFEVAPGSVFFDIISRVFNGRPFVQQHGFGKHTLQEDDALKVTIENDPTAGAFDDGSATYTSLRFSAEADWALLRALVIALVAIVFSTLFYIAARNSRVLQKHVFAPMVAEGAGGPDAFPGVCGWWAEVRMRIAEVVEPQLGLESKMVLRYVWFNVRLLAWASLCALMMIPAYELGAASDTWWILEAYKLDCDSHPDARAGASTHGVYSSRRPSRTCRPARCGCWSRAQPQSFSVGRIASNSPSSGANTLATVYAGISARALRSRQLFSSSRGRRRRRQTRCVAQDDRAR